MEYDYDRDYYQPSQTPMSIFRSFFFINPTPPAQFTTPPSVRQMATLSQRLPSFVPGSKMLFKDQLDKHELLSGDLSTNKL